VDPPVPGDALHLPGFPYGDVDMNRFNTMATGATGDRVRWVQRRLGLRQSAVFDADMEGALRSFQRRNGLRADGVIDPRTFARLCWMVPQGKAGAF
jgi:murein L,D-transpeptidase YcbB/YkuD